MICAYVIVMNNATKNLCLGLCRCASNLIILIVACFLLSGWKQRARLNRFADFRITLPHTRWFGVVFGLLLFAPQIGWAAGTPAGTTISNSATLAYSLGAAVQPNVTSTVSFLVDEKVNLTVVGGVTTTVATGATAQATAFTVTNNGNSALDFSLTVTPAIAGDNFDPTVCSAFVESGATAGYQAAQDIATYVDELPADTTKTVYAVCNIPAALVNGNTGLVGVTATARGSFNAAGYVATVGALGAVLVQSAGIDTVNVDIVFADVAGTEDIARDAQHSAHNTYSIGVASALTITKTVAGVLDPNGTAVLMPGAVMTYQIAVAFPGAGTATNLVVTDPLPANVTYVPGSIIVGGVTKTDAADADNAQFAANTVTVSLGNVAAPANIVITFRATIN